MLIVVMLALSSCQKIEKYYQNLTKSYHALTKHYRILTEGNVAFLKPPQNRLLWEVGSVCIYADTEEVLVKNVAQEISQLFKTMYIGKTSYFKNITYQDHSQDKKIKNDCIALTFFDSDIITHNSTYTETDYSSCCIGDQVKGKCIAPLDTCYNKRKDVTLHFELKSSQFFSKDNFHSTFSKSNCEYKSIFVYLDPNEIAKNFVKPYLPSTYKKPIDVYEYIDTILTRDNAEIYNAYHLVSVGRLDDAIVVYKKLLKIYPKNKELIFNIGYCHQALGDFSEAQIYYNQFFDKTTDDIKHLRQYQAENKKWLEQGVTQIRLK